MVLIQQGHEKGMSRDEGQSLGSFCLKIGESGVI